MNQYAETHRPTRRHQPVSNAKKVHLNNANGVTALRKIPLIVLALGARVKHAGLSRALTALMACLQASDRKDLAGLVERAHAQYQEATAIENPFLNALRKRHENLMVNLREWLSNRGRIETTRRGSRSAKREREVEVLRSRLQNREQATLRQLPLALNGLAAAEQRGRGMRGIASGASSIVV